MTGPHGDLQRGTSAEVVARHIRNAIEAGELRHQDQLPSTRALAEQWNTSVATISRAMQILGDEGIVINRARSSRIVNYPATAPKRRVQQDSPTILVIGGYAGSGKTEFGRIMARLTGWPMLDKDSTTRPVVDAALTILGYSPNDRESEFYLKNIRPAEYESLRMVAEENVKCGNSVIMTAPFIRELSDPAWTRRTIAEAEAAGASAHFAWVRCDVESMHTYIQRRGAGRDSHKLDHWDKYVAGLDLSFTPAAPHFIIENSLRSAPLIDQATEIVKRIQ